MTEIHSKFEQQDSFALTSSPVRPMEDRNRRVLDNSRSLQRYAIVAGMKSLVIGNVAYPLDNNGKPQHDLPIYPDENGYPHIPSIFEGL